MVARVTFAAGLALVAFAPALLAESAQVKGVEGKGIVTRAVVPPPQPEPRPPEPPFVPIVRDRLLFDYYVWDYGKSGFSIYLPQGGRGRQRSYYVLPRGRSRDRVCYLYWPLQGSTRVVLGLGAEGTGAVSYYCYQPVPSLYAPPYYPGDLERPGNLVLPTPTAGPPVPAEGPQPATPAPAPATRTFRSDLGPMLGGLSRTSMAFALGEAMLREGKFDEAVEAFRRVVAEDPRDGAGRLGLCLARAGAGQYGPAAEALREGLRQTSDWGFLKLDLSKALGSAEAAERLMGALQDAAGKEAGGGDAHLLLAFLHFATSEYRIAAQELWAAYDAGTLDAVAWELLLRCEHMLPADKGEQKGGPEG